MGTRILSGPELADNWWRVKPFVERALEHGTGDVSAYDLFIECLGATSQCWVRGDFDAIAITRIRECKQYKELVIVTTTGKGWFTFGPETLLMIEDFARGVGCKFTSIYGRKGWARVLKQSGYEQPYITLMKEL